MVTGAGSKVASLLLKSVGDTDTIANWIAANQGVTVEFIVPLTATSIMVFYTQGA